MLHCIMRMARHGRAIWRGIRGVGADGSTIMSHTPADPEPPVDGPLLVDRLALDPVAEREALVAGLLATPATLAPKYFYDELGCALYGAICQLPEYYPTRTEIALFQAHREAIAAAIGPGRQFVDLGAGDCCKAMGWLPFLAPARYIAVDIAASELSKALVRMAHDFPGLPLVGLATDFSRRLDLHGVLEAGPALFFYPGSSIGNFTPAQAVPGGPRSGRGTACRYRRPWTGAGFRSGTPPTPGRRGGALGVTAAFNRNALRHLNEAFGFDFDVASYGHVGYYDETLGRIEMHLESLRDQVVHLDGRARRFPKGERIHTENSYKYAPGEFEAMLRQAGFGAVRRWDAPAGGYYVYFAS